MKCNVGGENVLRERFLEESWKARLEDTESYEIMKNIS